MSAGSRVRDNPFGSSAPAAKPEIDAGSRVVAETAGADENEDGALYDVAGVGSASNPFSAAGGNTPAVAASGGTPRKKSNPFAPPEAEATEDEALYDVAGVGSISNPFSAAGGNVPAATSWATKTAQRQEYGGVA